MRGRTAIRLIGAGLAAAWLAGCSRVEAPEPFNPAIGPVIALAVQGVEVETRAPGPTEGNFIDQRRSGELRDAAASFLRARLQATGGSDWAQGIVEEATLIERPREVQGGVRGAFTLEPSHELIGTLGLKVALVDGLGIEKGYASARVQKRRGVLEGTSAVDRDREAQLLTRDLLQEISATLQRSIDENLASHRGF